MNSINFDSLIHSATYYLCYQDKIGRGFMVNESSLKYPIADYLTSLQMPMAKIQLEYNHPYLKKRRVDLIALDQPKNKSNTPKIEVAFEFKISKEETRYEPEQKRIFNDLMRLYMIANSTNANCYFLISGIHKDFIQHFRSIASTRPVGSKNTLPEPEGIYTEWFKFKLGEEKEFDVKNVTGNNYATIYQAFLKDYKPKIKGNKLNLPLKIKTKCVAISALSREFPTPYVGGIWKVE